MWLVKSSENLKLCASCCHNVTKNDDKYLGDETEVSIYKYLESISFPLKNKTRIIHPKDEVTRGTTLFPSITSLFDL